ncbi:hypothetical protein D3C72_1201880 [compost metagenome]
MAHGPEAGLAWCPAFAELQLQQAQDGIHRRADLMADGGQERGLGPVCGFRLHPGDFELTLRAFARGNVEPAAEERAGKRALVARRDDPHVQVPLIRADAHTAVDEVRLAVLSQRAAQRGKLGPQVAVASAGAGKPRQAEHGRARQAKGIGEQLVAADQPAVAAAQEERERHRVDQHVLVGQFRAQRGGLPFAPVDRPCQVASARGEQAQQYAEHVEHALRFQVGQARHEPRGPVPHRIAPHGVQHLGRRGHQHLVDDVHQQRR